MARAQPTPAVHYSLRLFDAGAHLFEIELTIARPAAEDQRVALPAWIPGSYMIREFSRHVVAIEASANGRRVALRKLDKRTWQLGRCEGPVLIRYRVYGWDLSVRGAHFDATHAFFNGTSVFLIAEGFENEPCTVDLQAPAEPARRNWKVATTLPSDGAPPFGFGRYRADNYDALIDHPVEIGTFTLATFTACGVRHDIAITGRHDCDTVQLCKDLKEVCEAQIRLFEPTRAKPPFERYLFLVTAVGDGYGGLEHRASTALICARNDLPYAGMVGRSGGDRRGGNRGVGDRRDAHGRDGYRRFLGLASHEYFHSWHVKRIKPAAFEPYDLARENYTRLLWIFEGFTSYYDDLMLVRAGVIDVDEYLKLLESTISNVMRTPGRRQQSVAESSFEAWTKYYRQDEQSPNSIVSYYAKGALVALALDLSLRSRSAGRRSLDHVMRLLWRRYGREFDKAREGLEEQAFPALLEQATGIDLKSEIQQWAYGTAELPLEVLLDGVGILLEYDSADPTPWLGMKTTMRGGELTVATAFTGGPAHVAGVSAGDTLIAFNGMKVDERSLKAQLARHRVGHKVTLHAFRRDELMTFELKLVAPLATEARLKIQARGTQAAGKLRKQWLGASGK